MGLLPRPEFIAISFIENQAAIIICAVLSAAAFFWIWNETRINKNLPENLRRRSWLYLVFIAVLAYLTYQRLIRPF